MRVERRQLERDDAQRGRATQVATMASSARQVPGLPRGGRMVLRRGQRSWLLMLVMAFLVGLVAGRSTALLSP